MEPCQISLTTFLSHLFLPFHQDTSTAVFPLKLSFPLRPSLKSSYWMIQGLSLPHLLPLTYHGGLKLFFLMMFLISSTQELGFHSSRRIFRLFNSLSHFCISYCLLHTFHSFCYFHFISLNTYISFPKTSLHKIFHLLILPSILQSASSFFSTPHWRYTPPLPSRFSTFFLKGFMKHS